MHDAETHSIHLSDPQDQEVLDYQAVSVLAVLGLIVGLLAVSALLTPVLWSVALAGIVLNGLALWRIAKEAPALIGRKPALVGLLLSVFFAGAAVGDWFTYRWLLRREATQFAALWFDFLRSDQPHKAHQLSRHPNTRRPLDEKLWKEYFEGSDQREELENYVARPEVRTLLALGPKAQVRYYDSPAQWQEGNRDAIDLVYAVTIPDAGQKKKSFFLNLILERHALGKPPRAEWQISNSEGGVRPDGKKPE
jgi:hypothetical protein